MLSRRLRASAAAAAAVSALFTSAPTAVEGTPSFTVSGQSFVLRASSMTVNGFTYQGQSIFTPNSGSPVTTIEFTLTSATSIAQLKEIVPCHDLGGGAQVISVVEAASAGATGGIHLFATEVKYTDASGHDWTVASPPPGTAPLALEPNGTTITAVEITALAVSIPSLQTSGQSSYTAFCTGGALAPQRAAPAPSAQPTPSESTSPTASPSPSQSPEPAPSPAESPSPADSPSPPPLPAPSPSPADSPSPSPLPAPSP